MLQQQIFTVVIPTHNRAHLIQRTIQSVLNQTFTDFELIVVDDGSTDDTSDVVSSFDDVRVRYLYKVNSGAADARNLGAKEAAGKYLTFLDSDDEVTPYWLEKIYSVFGSGADIVCCGYECVVYEEGAQAVPGRIVLPSKLGPMFSYQGGLFTKGGVFALQTELFETVGGYASGLSSGQHTELAMRLIPYCVQNNLRIACIYEPLMKHHLHTGPRIRTNPKAVMEGAKYIIAKHASLLQQEPPKDADYCAVVGVNSARLKDYGQARKYLFNAVRSDPRNVRNYVRFCVSLFPVIARKVWK